MVRQVASIVRASALRRQGLHFGEDLLDISAEARVIATQGRQESEQGWDCSKSVGLDTVHLLLDLGDLLLQ